MKTQNFDNTTDQKTLRNYLNVYLRRMSERREIVNAGLDFNNMEIIIPDRKKSFGGMYKAYNKPGYVSIIAVMHPDFIGPFYTHLYAIKLNNSGFDLIERCGWRKCDFQIYKNIPDYVLFLLTSPKLVLKEKDSENKPDFKFTRDRKNIDTNVHVHSFYGYDRDYRTDKNGYPLPTKEERNRKLNAFKAERARARFDASQIEPERARMAEVLLTVEKEIRGLSIIELCNVYGLSHYMYATWDRNKLLKAETQFEFNSIVAEFDHDIIKLRESMQKAIEKTENENN